MKHDRSPPQPAASLDVVLYALRAAGLRPDGIELSLADHRIAGYPSECQGIPLVVMSGGKESCVVLTQDGQAERVSLDLGLFALWFARQVPNVFEASAPAHAR